MLTTREDSKRGNNKNAFPKPQEFLTLHNPLPGRKGEVRILAFHLLFLTLADYPSLLPCMQQLMPSHRVILSTFSYYPTSAPSLSHAPTLNKHKIRPG